MKQRTPIKSLTLIAILCSIGSFKAVAAEKLEANVSWKASGELEEACSCRAACPCWFKSLPTRMTCDGAQVIFINKGRYGKTPLDGLAVAQFVQSPEHQTMFESFGRWNLDYIYIDEKADAAQRQALKTLASKFFPPGAKKRVVRYVPITRTIQGAEHTSTVGNYAICSGHLIEGGYGGAPKITNPPLADPTHREFSQGETTKLAYKDAGQNWAYKKSNYMYARFRVDDGQYAKYEEALAKKMGQVKRQM